MPVFHNRLFMHRQTLAARQIRLHAMHAGTRPTLSFGIQYFAEIRK